MTLSELRRALCGRTFLYALCINGLALAFGLYEYTGSWSFQPRMIAGQPSFYYNAYGAFLWATQDSILVLLVPLIAALPFADSLVIDRKSGYLRAVLLRTSQGKYALAKWLACMCAGGLALTIPLVLLFGLTNVLFERGINLSNFESRENLSIMLHSPFGSLYRSSPDIYILTTILIWFLGGSAYSLLGLAAATVAENRYVALATPVLLFFVGNLLIGILNIPAYSLYIAFAPRAVAYVTWYNILFSLGSVLVIGLSIFMIAVPKMKMKA